MPAPQPRPIRLLDSSTIDRIAAGEVIERPASVVKELVENALDAGARSVRIMVQEGGLASLVVEDDGHGIPWRELPLACERHATSKIGSAADIVSVGTFGFRGEALASIASVSRLTIISRAEGEEVGGLHALIAGRTDRREPAPRTRGTTVQVDDLFFNTPARRKFMGTAPAERRAIVNLVTAFALATPEVRWRLTADGETLLDLLPVESLPARARELLGPAVMEHMARFEKEQGGLSVMGLASRPTWTRGNRSQQYIYVNRRPIRSATLTQAIAQAYRDVVPPGRHPVAIIFIQVPPGEVDVNVHPAKSEVRLLLERSVFGLIHAALQDGLNLKRAGPFDLANDVTGPASSGVAADPEALAGMLRGIAAAERDYYERRFGGDGSEDDTSGQGRLFSGRPAGGGFPSTSGGVAPSSSSQSGPTMADETLQRSALFWQLHRTYILAQIRGGLVMIDQHNSHERILYNEAQKALGDGGASVPTQQLLFPVNLELAPGQIQAYLGAEKQLEKLGFLIQPFGGHAILVQGIPASLKNWSEGQMLLDILDDLSEGADPADESRKDLLASFACHGAIRAGELLNVAEMQNLVDRLFATDLPLSCPHGRPTLIQFPLDDLEKRFGRR
jgi:DNA mismatch repair protein MutL